MLYGPSKEPRTDGTTATAPASEQRKRRAPRITPRPDGARHPRTVKFVEATARRRSEDHVRRNRHRPAANPAGCSKEPDAFRPKLQTRPDASFKSECGNNQERRMILSCPYNVRFQPRRRPISPAAVGCKSLLGRIPGCRTWWPRKMPSRLTPLNSEAAIVKPERLAHSISVASEIQPSD